MTPRILRTVFLTSVFAYMGFAYLEYVEPGVVSDVMSVHLWLVPIVVSGVWWAIVEEKVKSEKGKVGTVPGAIAAMLVGLVFGGIMWHNGGMFGDFRLLLALGAAALPGIAYYSLLKSH